MVGPRSGYIPAPRFSDAKTPIFLFRLRPRLAYKPLPCCNIDWRLANGRILLRSQYANVSLIDSYKLSSSFPTAIREDDKFPTGWLLSS